MKCTFIKYKNLDQDKERRWTAKHYQEKETNLFWTHNTWRKISTIKPDNGWENSRKTLSWKKRELMNQRYTSMIHLFICRSFSSNGVQVKRGSLTFYNQKCGKKKKIKSFTTTRFKIHIQFWSIIYFLMWLDIFLYLFHSDVILQWEQ